METLKVRNRQRLGKGGARALRREGRIPAIAYSGGKEPLQFDLNASELLKALQLKGKNTLLNLDLEGENHTVMLKYMQRHPIYRRPMHADFQLVDMNVKVQVRVLLDYVGRPFGTTRGGKLEAPYRSVGIECLPADIPLKVSHDVSALDIGDKVTLAELSFPEGVVPTGDPDIVVVQVVAPFVEEEPKEGEEQEGEGSAEE